MPLAIPLPDLILFISIGAGLGFFGGLFGIGGGIIAVPLFVIGFGMDQALAQGTALVLMVPNLLIAWWRYNKNHKVPLLASFLIGMSACITTWFMAKLAVNLSQDMLHWVFNGFILLVGIHLFLVSRKIQLGLEQAQLKTSAMPVVGFLGGTAMGLLGMGGSLVSTPLLTNVLKQNQTVAQSLSLALVAPSSIIALSTYAHAHKVNWGFGLPLAFGGLFTVSLGVALAHHLPEHILRRSFACVMVVTALWLMVQSII